MRTKRFRGILLATLMIASLITPTTLLLSHSLTHAALTPHGPIYINGNAGFTIPDPVNGGGSGTENDPYIIENWDTSGISIRNTTAHVIIRNCYVHDSYYGIYLGDSTNITLDNNILDNNRYNFEVWGSDQSHFIHDIDKTNLVNGKPIYYLIDNSNLVINQDNTVGYLGLISCDNIRVENLVIGSNEQGIFLAYTENSWIENCVFSNNENSIHLWKSNNNTLTGNTCDNSNGIHLEYSDNNILSGNNCVNAQYYGYGIYLVHSDNNILIGNTCDNNYSYGISLYGFNDNNTLFGNVCKNNTRGIHLGGHTQNYNNTLINNTCENNEYGIYIHWSDNNHIYHNNLINNTTQAYDDGSNYWDNGYPSGGNYWSDYTGVDIYRGENQDIRGSDGIGDTPHYDDRYPLMNPFPLPWTGWVRTLPICVIMIFPPPSLHIAHLEMNLALYQGSKLVLKFYSWDKGYEGENVIENFTPPWEVKENKVVPHPEGEAVEVIRLVLTTDNTENEISTIAWFIVTRDIFNGRLVDIYLEWPFASPEERNAWFSEISDIYMHWPFAPISGDWNP